MHKQIVFTLKHTISPFTSNSLSIKSGPHLMTQDLLLPLPTGFRMTGH